MKDGNLSREQVTPLLETGDAALLRTALGVIAERPGWGKEIVGLLREWLAHPDLDKTRQESLRGLLQGLGKEPAVQEAMAQALADVKTPTAGRLLALEAMGRALPAKTPSSWIRELGRALEHREQPVVQQAIVSIRAANLQNFDSPLLRLARDKAKADEVRLSAFAAAAPRAKELSPDIFVFLTAQLDKEKPALTRLAAANSLSHSRLSLSQLEALVPLTAAAGALELAPLLATFEKGSELTRAQPKIGADLATALQAAPGLASLTPGSVERLFSTFPDTVRQQASKLVERLQADAGKQKERLAELESHLKGGDGDRGRLVFFGTKASCSACHAIKGAGGQIGPDLTTIAAIRSGRDLLEAVIFPSSSFARGYEPYVVETRDGRTHTGVLGRETTDAIYLVTTERAEILIPRGTIETLVPSRVSIMPQGLDVQLSRQELADLMAFIQSLR
jgi:putative heme-binding domain-containing protein